MGFLAEMFRRRGVCLLFTKILSNQFLRIKIANMSKTIELRRVVITGVGLVTPVGVGTQQSWDSILKGVSGAATFDDSIDHAGFSVHFGCQVKDFDIANYMNPREAKRVDKFVHFTVASAQMAKEDAALDLEKTNLERCGSVFASGIGGILSVEEQLRKYLENYGDGEGDKPRKAAKRISPFSVPLLMVNAGCGQVAIEFGFKGINYAPVTACASGSHAIGLAFRHIQVGDADVMITGGSEAGIGIMGLGGFSSMKALSTRNDDPARACRPFDKDRDGFVMGEGAGSLVLEELEHAKARGAKIYAEVIGYGFTDDASHITAPSDKGEGIARAMNIAMAHGDVKPEEIDYINAHGTSTPLNDKSESAGIKLALGEENARKVSVSSTKSCTGHMLGAAGGVELGFCALAIRDSIVPPTINYETPDPDCDLDVTPNAPKKRDIRYAMSNSLGFGGHNASLLIGRYEE